MKKADIDMEVYVQYHLTRTLKALQDDLDKTKSVKTRVEIATAMDKLLDTASLHELRKRDLR